MGVTGCLLKQVLYLWTVKDTHNNAEFWTSLYGGCRKHCLFCLQLITEANYGGTQTVGNAGYLCQLVSSIDAIALAILALSICRAASACPGLDLLVFYLDSLDRSQLLPFLQQERFSLSA